MGNVKFEFATGKLSVKDLLQAPLINRDKSGGLVDNVKDGNHWEMPSSGWIRDDDGVNSESLLVVVPLTLSKKFSSGKMATGDDDPNKKSQSGGAFCGIRCADENAGNAFLHSSGETMELRLSVSRYSI